MIGYDNFAVFFQGGMEKEIKWTYACTEGPFSPFGPPLAGEKSFPGVQRNLVKVNTFPPNH